MTNAVASAASADRRQTSRIQTKLTWRLVAPLTVLIVLNSLDRVNVSFAALRMNHDLGLSPQGYGLGISVFFLGYIVLQFPHALSQRWLGPRVWIFATVLIWGALAAAMAFVRTPATFYVLRFLLGCAEGGFAPGVVHFISRWAPRRYRGWAVAGTMLAIPISVVLGGPLSGWLLSMGANPVGIAGWRWMFLIEGLIPMALAFVTLSLFDDRLEDARWLTPVEKLELRQELDAETAQAVGSARGLDRLLDARIWGCIVAWFCLMTGAYALLFWMPQMVKQMSNLGDFAISAITAVPWVGFGVGMMLNAWLSDRAQERFWHFGAPAALSCVLLSLAASLPAGAAALACVTLAGLCMGAAQGAYWPIPISFLTAGAAAAGITLINLLGNSSGLITPPLIGWIRRETGSFQAPIYVMAALMLLAALVMIPLARAAARPIQSRRHSAPS